MSHPRRFSFLDNVCLGVDQALRAVAGHAKTSDRSYPAAGVKEASLSSEQRQQVAAFMRINHAGEVCAQALYQGQGLVSRDPAVKGKMQQAMREEGDHLAWCSLRLTELASHTSYANPVWYLGSFAIGITAGLLGDRWSLGFLAETEHQVVKHLNKHLAALPAQDERSYTILKQMQEDEAQHRDDAREAGAAELPKWVKKLMGITSKVMVKTASWL